MNRLFQPGWPGNLIALLAGALTTLALAPYGIWPLALLSIALLYRGLRALTPRQAAWRGWWYGFGLFASGCLLYTSPSPRDVEESRMPSSA